MFAGLVVIELFVEVVFVGGGGGVVGGIVDYALESSRGKAA